MGMQIHRAVGWATTHPSSSVLRNRLDEECIDGEVEAFVRSRAVKNAFLQLPRNNVRYPLRFSDLLHQVCGPDFKENDWIIAPPAYALKWFRRDDMLDWAAVRHAPDWQRNTIVEMPSPPNPYNLFEDEAVPPIILCLMEEFGFDSARLMPAVATWWS